MTNLSKFSREKNVFDLSLEEGKKIFTILILNHLIEKYSSCDEGSEKIFTFHCFMNSEYLFILLD